MNFNRLTSTRRVIGVDIGGTQIKLGVVQGSRILIRQVLPTRPVAASPDRLQKHLAAAVLKLARDARLHRPAVGVGIPGLVRSPEGIVTGCANLKGWNRIPLKKNLERLLRSRVEVDNDVHAMTLAEWIYGAGQGADSLIGLTLGTGVGGGIVLGGQLYRGRRGSVAEIGHLPIVWDGPACPCGGRGCLERFVGNQEILRAVRSDLRRGVRTKLRALTEGRPSRLTPEMIDAACRLGDPYARQVWAGAGERVGWALAGVVNLLDPERIVVGGGIAKAGRWILEPMRRTVRQRAIRSLRDVKILPAKLGESAGLIGAGLLARGVGA